MKPTNTDNDKNKKTHSIRFEISASFLATMILTFGLWFIINFFFMDGFYFQKKKEVIITAYNKIELAIADKNIESDSFDSEIRNICESYNIDMLVLDTHEKAIKSSTRSGFDFLAEALWGDIMMDTMPKNDGVERTVIETGEVKPGENYTILIYNDTVTRSKYLDIWGQVEDGYMIFVRSTLAGIEENVSISNTFMLYAGLVAVFVGSILVLYISKKFTDPIKKLYLISDEMKELNFEAKYENRSSFNNEIDILGQNMNELSESLEEAIKELKNANVALKHDIAKKEEIDEMRKEFLSNVSHELKTPIALIQGYAEGLKEGVNDDEESKNFYCEVIMDEASKMNIMVKKLLTLNQLVFGNEGANMERFDIVEMVKNYVRSAELLAKQKDVTIKFGRYHPIFVWGDEFRIEEVLQNYYSNAINHVSGDKIIEIKLVHKEGKVRVSVFNTGKPIPKDSIDHIWDKFYKVDKARTREYGGSGVGLSIVKAIMESMHQNYGVINYANGVEFYFELETK